MFDRANRYGTGLRGPRILYHYTSWDAAVGIVTSQRMRATAHDCTNDDAELTSADATIVDAVRNALQTSRGIVTRRVLRLFIERYEDVFKIGASRRAYLVCFSTAKDDPTQWMKYGAGGAGVCLGVRLFDIPEPRIEGIASTFMPVNYDESLLREKMEGWLREFVSVADRAQDIEHNWRLALDILNVTAAAWALTTKHSTWREEQEVRAILLAREGKRITPTEETRPDGSIKRYLPVPLTRLSRIPIEEFIIGPNQDFAAGRRRALNLLVTARYPNAASKIVISEAPVEAPLAV